VIYVGQDFANGEDHRVELVPFNRELFATCGGIDLPVTLVKAV
jgi:hypothetical protein